MAIIPSQKQPHDPEHSVPESYIAASWGTVRTSRLDAVFRLRRRQFTLRFAFLLLIEKLRLRLRRERVRRVRQPQHPLQARGARRIHRQG